MPKGLKVDPEKLTIIDERATGVLRLLPYWRAFPLRIHSGYGIGFTLFTTTPIDATVGVVSGVPPNFGGKHWLLEHVGRYIIEIHGTPFNRMYDNNIDKIREKAPKWSVQHGTSFANPINALKVAEKVVIQQIRGLVRLYDDPIPYSSVGMTAGEIAAGDGEKL